MRLFLDSSVIIATGVRLDSQGLQTLCDFADRDDVELVTSQVVIDEVANKFREELTDHVSKSRSSLDRLSQLVNEPHSLALTAEHIESWVEAYRNQVASLFEDTGGCIIPIPDVPHGDLVARAIRGTKPFGGKNDGYRDTLIWYSVLDALAKAKNDGLEVLYFGTGNTRDFATRTDDSLRLHDDLIADVVAHVAAGGDVVLFGSIGEILGNQIKFQLAELAKIQSRIINRTWKRGEFDDDVASAVFHYLQLRPERVLPPEVVWDDVDVDATEIREYQDARVSTLDGGFYSVQVDAVSESVVTWDVFDEAVVPRGWTAERRETKWGTQFAATVSTTATL